LFHGFSVVIPTIIQITFPIRNENLDFLPFSKDWLARIEIAVDSRLEALFESFIT